MRLRPQIGVDEQPQPGRPLGEETLDEARRVERDELMQRAFRQALFGKRRRGNRAGRDQNGKILEPAAAR